VEETIDDLIAHAQLGFEEIMVDLQGLARDAEELKDIAAEVYEKARAAGV
jgi:hypothetical protein